MDIIDIAEKQMWEIANYLAEHDRPASYNYHAKYGLSDAELEALISKHPSSLEELMQVRGFGKKKAEKYGQDILQVFQEFG